MMHRSSPARLFLSIVAALICAVPLPAFALTVCKTSDSARVINQIQNQAAEEGTTLDANPMGKATVQSLAAAYCGRTEGADPVADNTQQIEFGCTMFSGMYQEQRVYWTTCPSHVATFNMTNGTGNDMAIAFYSQTRPGLAWPGGGDLYRLAPSEFRSFGLTCKYAETICYGSVIASDPEGTYWGVGMNGVNPCNNCCITCGNSFATRLTY